MISVKVRDGEHFESAFKRFNRTIKNEGIIPEVRRRGAFESPAEKARRKETAAKKRAKRAKTERFQQ